ncbi:MAG TPA: RNase adapter RapZ [Ignavibacteria bacterium]|nr:RNase adapter RapZ [Ignavibacteria bacterium]
MPLKITLHSFSYKKCGVPADPTGNGGGFIFDCRFIYNPGRKEEFKKLTGMDKEVAVFLEEQKEMQKFLNNVFDIIDPAIENYLERDFTDLMIGFGCTGGQHRSVYAAEKTKQHIDNKFANVSVELHHDQIVKGLNFTP